ncbi:unnamed protein product [Closterium sp. NIES-64]|nr:unnamed protein product [Closterium sp. NIES-64]
MDFLGALGRDCTAESDPAPRPLPLARPAASVPISPPESADQIRHRFEDQQREQARRAGRSLSPPEPLRAGSILRSGAEAVALQECSPRRRSSAARDDKWESHRDDRHVPTATLARLWSLAASLQSLERILQESFDSMPLWLNTSGMLAAVEADPM